MKSTLTIVPEVLGRGKGSEHGCLDSPRDETPQRHAEKWRETAEPAAGNRLNVRGGHAQNAQEGQIEVLSGSGS